MKRSTIGWSVVALTTAIVMMGAPANADERDEFSDIEGDPTSSLTVEDSDGVNARLAPLNSPAGCNGQTDRAHQSELTYASVHGRTRCAVNVPSLGVTTILQKQGWAYWESMLTTSSSRSNAKDSQDAHPHWTCLGWASQNYRGVSTHWSQESSGRYSATTVGAEWRFYC